MKKTSILSTSLLFLVAACGGGGGSTPGSSGNGTATGQLIDSAVEGIAYTSGNQSGVTDANGNFTYEVGKTVTFKIGNITIGTSTGKATITPLDWVPSATDETNAQVSNLVRFLQTLDDDRNPANGIKIRPEVRTAAATASTPLFNQSTSAFAADATVASLVSALTPFTSAGTGTLVSLSAAQQHFKSTLLKRYAGNYAGTFAGQDNGTWQISVTTGGSITGKGYSNGYKENLSIAGTMTSSGTASLNAAVGVAGAAIFIATINPDTGAVSGTWSSPSLNQSGTLIGSK